MGSETYLFVYAPLILCIIFLIERNTGQELSPPQVVAPKSPQIDVSSKINRLSSSRFRDRIVQLQRQQLQPIQQQQITSKVISSEQQVIQQQQQPIQTVQLTEQQQSVNDLSFVQDHEDSQQSTYTSGNSESFYGSVQGTPGVDFPNYSAIPNTKFSCEGVPFEPGMYADESTGCQVYHLCYQGRRESFLCGIGTVFNQAILNCDFWHSVDCSKSSLYYGINAEFGKSAPEPGGNNFQSFSQTSISQTEQSILPVKRVQQQVIENYEQSSIVKPVAPSFVINERNFESRQEFSGGKISPPKQQLTSSFISSVSDGKQTASQPIGRLRDTLNLGAISPGRKAALLNRGTSGAQQITSAESSTIRSLSMQVGATKSGKLSATMANLNSRVNQVQQIDKKQTKSLATFQSSSKSSSSSSKTIKDHSLDLSENSVWKPYSRAKGKTSSSKAVVQSEVSSVPPAPVHQVPNVTPGDSVVPNTSTSPDGDTTTSTRPDLPPPTVAQPDQEPTFSSIENNQSSTADEVPKIPSSSTPPPTEPPMSSTNEPSTEASPSASIESDDSSALSTTTPEPTPESAEGPTSTTISDSNPVTSETPAPTTIGGETSTQEDADPSKSTTSSVDETTKSSDEPSEATMTTTVSAATESETSAQPETTTTANPETESPASQAESEKKKRGAAVIGVEYANRGGGKKFENSSSVIYADKKESGQRTQP